MDYIYFIIDFILHIDRHLNELVANYGQYFYIILFLIIFCETGLVVTPFLPGDSLLFVAGALAAVAANGINIHLLVVLLVFAAVLGDGANYLIGHFFGAKLFKNPHSKIFKQEYLEKTQHFYQKHGGKAIIFARFVPIIRTFAPFIAGMGKMSYRHFSLFNLIGGLVWVTLFTYLGYFFGRMPFIQRNLEFLVIGIIFVSIFVAVLSECKIFTKRSNKNNIELK